MEQWGNSEEYYSWDGVQIEWWEVAHGQYWEEHHGGDGGGGQTADDKCQSEKPEDREWSFIHLL